MTPLFLNAPIFGDSEIRECLNDQAFASAMVDVEIALVRAQAELGIVPKDLACAIAEKLKDVKVPLTDLGDGVSSAGVPVPVLLTALRAHLTPQEADWLHFGATSQDVVDTAMCLCLGRALEVFSGRLSGLIDGLEKVANQHAETMMLARTRGQLATPISFGARVAQWAQPLIGLEAEVSEIRRVALRIQLGGASGTRNVFAAKGAEIAMLMAKDLGLETAAPWHADRGGMRRLANWMARCIAATAKFGRDFAISSRGEIQELRPQSGGGSSTMPHKSNPIKAEALQSVAAVAVACEAGLSAASVHCEERDGAMWPVEWLMLPLLSESTGAALVHAQDLLESMVVNADQMRARIEDIPAVHSEAAVFALAPTLGRAKAGQLVKEALSNGESLEALLREHGDDATQSALSDQAYAQPAASAVKQIFAAREKPNA